MLALEKEEVELKAEEFEERAAEQEINQIDNKPSSLIFESLIQTIGAKN